MLKTRDKKSATPIEDFGELARKFKDLLPKTEQPYVYPRPYMPRGYDTCPNCGYCPHCGRGGRQFSGPIWMRSSNVGPTC